MSTRDKHRPTKVQAVFMGVMALLLLANTAVAVLVDGRPATAFLWTVVAMNLALLGLNLWLYRRAVKSPSTRS